LIAAARGQKDAERNREIAAKAMTPAEIARAQQLAAEWKPRTTH
jgi:hypothetical protein